MSNFFGHADQCGEVKMTIDSQGPPHIVYSGRNPLFTKCPYMSFVLGRPLPQASAGEGVKARCKTGLSSSAMQAWASQM